MDTLHHAQGHRSPFAVRFTTVSKHQATLLAPEFGETFTRKQRDNCFVQRKGSSVMLTPCPAVRPPSSPDSAEIELFYRDTSWFACAILVSLSPPRDDKARPNTNESFAGSIDYNLCIGSTAVHKFRICGACKLLHMYACVSALEHGVSVSAFLRPRAWERSPKDALFAPKTLCLCVRTISALYCCVAPLRVPASAWIKTSFEAPFLVPLLLLLPQFAVLL